MTPPHHHAVYSPVKVPTAGVIFENPDITRKVE